MISGNVVRLNASLFMVARANILPLDFTFVRIENTLQIPIDLIYVADNTLF